MGQTISNLLFELGDDYNKVSRHNCNFKLTQTLRLIMIVSCFAIWGLLLYIWAKTVLSQLVFWSLSLWIFAISTLAISSGREVCEIKMLGKLKDKKLEEGSILPEQVDDIELPAEEKSQMWRRAIIYYDIAGPLLVSIAIMLVIDTESMLSGQVCKFYELAGNKQEECLADYANNPSKYILASGFRYDVYLAGVMMPVIFYFIEFFLNQIVLSWKHIVYQYLFTVLYGVVTAAWQHLTGNAVIFPGSLDWICSLRAGASSDCLFNECILWFIIFMAVQTVSYSVILYLHFLK